MSRLKSASRLVDDRLALPPPLGCSWTDGGPFACWVHVSGALTTATVAQMQATLGKPQLQTRLVVVDLRELQFIDIAGVQAIVDASIDARRDGRRMVLLRAPAHVDRMFALTGTSAKLEIGDLDRVEPPVQALLHLAAQELVT